MLSWWTAGDGWELEAAALRAFGAACFAVVALVVFGTVRLVRESRRPNYFPTDAFRGHTVVFAPTRTGMSGHYGEHGSTIMKSPE